MIFVLPSALGTGAAGSMGLVVESRWPAGVAPADDISCVGQSMGWEGVNRGHRKRVEQLCCSGGVMWMQGWLPTCCVLPGT